MTEIDDPSAIEVWRAACERLSDVGAEILSDPMVADERDGAEGIRHLLRQLMFAVQSEIEFADPAAPALLRFDDDVVKWGGPNADNHYFRSAIDPGKTYRFRTNTSGVRQLILSLHEGDMQFGELGVFGERSLDDLKVADDGTLVVSISPDQQPGNWIETVPAARLFLVRLYVADWERDAIPPMLIENVDAADAGSEPLSLESVQSGMDRAIHWIERSVPFWFNYLRGMTAAEVNTLSPPATPPGGASDIAYGGGLWRLSTDEAWLIEFPVPDADYWSVQTQTWPFFESGDLARHQTSLNHTQAHVDGDDTVRLVVSARDPGVPNWLDTEGRPEGLIVYRWIWARSRPVPRGRVVPIDDVPALMTVDHPQIEPSDRVDLLAARRRSVHRRFRR